jgi:hypothetical protein
MFIVVIVVVSIALVGISKVLAWLDTEDKS